MNMRLIQNEIIKQMNIFSKASAVSLGFFKKLMTGTLYLTKVKSKWRDK